MKQSFITHSSLLIFCLACSRNHSTETTPDPTSRKSAEASEFSDENAQGMLDGEDWTLAGSETRIADNGTFHIILTAQIQKGNCLTKSTVNPHSVTLKLKSLKAGTTAFPTPENEYIELYPSHKGTDTRIFSSGRILIESVAGDVISGKIAAKLDEQNFVNGVFTSTICR